MILHTNSRALAIVKIETWMRGREFLEERNISKLAQCLKKEKKMCVEIDVVRRRVTAETLGMGSAGGCLKGLGAAMRS